MKHRERRERRERFLGRETAVPGDLGARGVLFGYLLLAVRFVICHLSSVIRSHALTPATVRRLRTHY